MQMPNQKIDFMPEQGNIDSLFDRIDKYILAVDKNWKNNIKPAKKGDIERLINLSKIKEKDFDLPADYQIFLNYMGENDAGILSKTLLADTNITSLLDYYEEENKFEPESVNSDYLVFALFNMGDQLSFDFNRSDGPKIIFSTDGEFVRDYSGNFEKLLFQSAFVNYEKMRFSEFASYGGSLNSQRLALSKSQFSNINDIVDVYIANNNFIKAWFSDCNHCIGYRHDMAFIVETGNGILLDVYGKSKASVNALGAELSLSVGTKYKTGTIG